MRFSPVFVRTGMLVPLLAAGCLSEGSFPLQPGDLTPPAPLSNPIRKVSTRQWLSDWAARHKPLLPDPNEPPLLTEDLTTPDGKPADVFRHFGLRPDGLASLFTNFNGIRYTANACATRTWVETPPPEWPGFDTVWIPVAPEVSLCGRIGWRRDGSAIRDATCIVILPGFFGDNGVNRTRDLAAALVAAGYHVLAVEVRGHGQTEARYPNVYYRFGARETEDLMHVSDWLGRQPHVTRVGLVGFCWSANQAMLCAGSTAAGRATRRSRRILHRHSRRRRAARAFRPA